LNNSTGIFCLNAKAFAEDFVRISEYNTKKTVVNGTWVTPRDSVISLGKKGSYAKLSYTQ